MEICHVTSVHTTFDTRIFHKECKTLAQAGHNVTLIAQADRPGKTVDGVRVIGLPKITRRYQRIGLWRQIVREVKKLAPDVVHFHDPELLLVAPWFRPAKIVYDCHEPYAETMLSKIWVPPWLRHPLSRAVALLEPALAKRVDAIVVTVDSHAGRFERAGRPVILLHNFPMLDGFDVPGHTGGRTIIHLGQQTKTRGCSVIIEMMRLLAQQVPEARLLLVGPFDDPEYQDELERRIAAYGLEQAVVLTGQVPYTDVPGWLAQSSIGLIALQEAENYKTSVPTKLFEYMISGLPVVASDLAPARRFMDGLECGFLVEPAEPRGYAEAIAYLLGHPKEAGRMGENGRRAVEEKYNWPTEALKLTELYQELQ